MFDQILTVTVVLLPTIFAVVIEVVSEDIKTNRFWRTAVLTFGIVTSVLTFYQIHRADRVAATDREDAIQKTSEKVSASVSESVSKSVTQAVSQQYAKTIEGLNLQIGSLKAQLDAIRGSDIVTGKNPIRVQVTNPQAPSESGPEIHGSVIQTTPDPQYGKFTSQVILTTNKVMNGAKVRIKCPAKINHATVWVAGSSQMFGGGALEDEHTYATGISSPNWAPDYPIVLTLYHDSPALGNCNITPLP